jgi:hypothetical protein
VAIENLRKHLILALSVFQFAFWLWIYSHPKKKHWEKCREPTHPRSCWLWSGRRTWFSGGNNLFLIPRDCFAKLRSARSRLLPTLVFSSTKTHSQDGRKSGGVVIVFSSKMVQSLVHLLLSKSEVWNLTKTMIWLPKTLSQLETDLCYYKFC